MSDKIYQPNTAWSFYRDSICGWAAWDNAFSKEECQWIIDYSKVFQSHTAEVGIAKDEVATINDTVNTDIRNSKITWLHPTKEFSWVYDRLTAVVIKLNQDNYMFDLFGFQEGLQFTEYTAPSGHYGKHVDIIFGGPVRKLSLTLQLTDPNEYEGGDLEMHLGSKPAIMEKKQGSIIVFPSGVLHEVTPVTKGTRHSLVGWITGKPFK
jgi:PKHD-type hydroxylase